MSIVPEIYCLQYNVNKSIIYKLAVPLTRDPWAEASSKEAGMKRLKWRLFPPRDKGGYMTVNNHLDTP